MSRTKKNKSEKQSKKTDKKNLKIENVENKTPTRSGRSVGGDGSVEKKENRICGVAIIGGGCAGLTAALYCARAELKPFIFTGSLQDKGGLLVKTSVVENYPGFPDGILGYDLITGMETQAVKFGATVINSQIESIDLEANPKKLVDSDGLVYYAAAVIIATGSTPNKLGLNNENELWSKGISSCAVCDGALYKKKKIIVVGGGDSAMEEAAFLTKFSDVTLIHRGESFRASKAMQNKVLNNERIKILYNTVITKLNGTEFIESITCQNIKTKETFDLKVDGLFYGLGLKPNSHLFKGLLQLDSENYILKGENNEHFTTMTSIDGVFVAGDVHDKIYRQAIVACGDGCRAAMDSIKWCEKYNMESNGNKRGGSDGDVGCVFN